MEQARCDELSGLGGAVGQQGGAERGGAETGDGCYQVVYQHLVLVVPPAMDIDLLVFILSPNDDLKMGRLLPDMLEKIGVPMQAVAGQVAVRERTCGGRGGAGEQTGERR